MPVSWIVKRIFSIIAKKIIHKVCLMQYLFQHDAFAWISHFQMLDSAKLEVQRFPFQEFLMVTIEALFQEVYLLLLMTIQQLYIK